MVISFPLLWHHFRWNSRNLFTGLLYTKTAQARKTEEQRQQQQKQSNTHTNKIGIIALMNIYLFIGWYLVVNLISCVSIRVLVFVTICYMVAVLIYSVYYTMWIHAWDRIGLDRTVGWTKCVKADFVRVSVHTCISLSIKMCEMKMKLIKYISIHTLTHAQTLDTPTNVLSCWNFCYDFFAFLAQRGKKPWIVN